MKKNITTLVGVSLIVGLTIVGTVPAFAEERTEQQPTQQVEPAQPTGDRTTTKEPTTTERRTEITKRIDQLKAEPRTELNEKQRQTCENRAEKINQLIKKRSEEAQKHLEKFKSVATRVEEFVTTKHRTVANYDSLVATINEKEAAAQAAIDANSAATFQCATVDAKDPGKLPRAHFDAVRDALKEYRTAIKNLIVQVKSAGDGERSAQ